MSFLTAIENIWAADEAYVQKFFATAEGDAQKVITWIAAHQQEIENDIAAVLSAIALATPGLTGTAAAVAAAAVKAMNVAATAVNAEAAAVAAGKSTIQTIAATYQAVKNTQIATATAQNAVAAIAATTVEPAAATQ